MKKLKLTGVRLGMNHDIPIRVESASLVFKPIVAMANSAPLSVESTAHGIPDAWRACVMGGMADVSVTAPVKDSDLKRLAVIDADTIEFPGINAEKFKAYAGGGQLAFYAPLDLTPYSIARMDLKKSLTGPIIKTLSTADATMEIDAANSVVWLRIADDTLVDSGTLLNIPASTYLFDIELETGAGDVIALCSAESTIEITPEVTTSV
jgi:hypothetical protein